MLRLGVLLLPVLLVFTVLFPAAFTFISVDGVLRFLLVHLLAFSTAISAVVIAVTSTFATTTTTLVIILLIVVVSLILLLIELFLLLLELLSFNLFLGLEFGIALRLLPALLLVFKRILNHQLDPICRRMLSILWKIFFSHFHDLFKVL